MVLNNSNFLEKIVQVYMRYHQQWRADVLFIAPVFCFSLLLVGLCLLSSMEILGTTKLLSLTSVLLVMILREPNQETLSLVHSPGKCKVSDFLKSLSSVTEETSRILFLNLFLFNKTLLVGRLQLGHVPG